MALVSNAEREQIAARIAEVERNTDAELVTVLAARSDDYRYAAILWAALVALCIPSVLLVAYELGANVSVPWLVAIQLGVFCVSALLFRLPGVQHRLVPRTLRHWRAAAMARRQFLEQGLHHTAGETGILIFVSEAERYVEILADRGIHERVPDARWDDIVAEFVNAVRAGETLRGFEHAIARCGAILAEAVPKSPDNRNELDDRLILIGYD
jgi:putative membrane protein